MSLPNHEKAIAGDNEGEVDDLLKGLASPRAEWTKA